MLVLFSNNLILKSYQTSFKCRYTITVLRNVVSSRVRMLNSIHLYVYINSFASVSLTEFRIEGESIITLRTGISWSGG